MRPHFRARIPGSTACVIRNTDERLTWMISFQLASDICSMLSNVDTAGVVHEDVHRAKTSVDRRDKRRDIGALRDIAPRDERASARRADGVRRRTRVSLAADVIHRDVAARFGQRERDRFSNPAAAARHERNPS